jgi:hypothetical protein
MRTTSDPGLTLSQRQALAEYLGTRSGQYPGHLFVPSKAQRKPKSLPWGLVLLSLMLASWGAVGLIVWGMMRLADVVFH